MAKLKGGLPFKGSLDNISVYTRWDMDTPIVRQEVHRLFFSRQKLKRALKKISVSIVFAIRLQLIY